MDISGQNVQLESHFRSKCSAGITACLQCRRCFCFIIHPKTKREQTDLCSLIYLCLFYFRETNESFPDTHCSPEISDLLRRGWKHKYRQHFLQPSTVIRHLLRTIHKTHCTFCITSCRLEYFLLWSRAAENLPSTADNIQIRFASLSTWRDLSGVFFFFPPDSEFPWHFLLIWWN